MRFMRFSLGLGQIARSEVCARHNLGSEKTYCLFSITCFWICTYLFVALTMIFLLGQLSKVYRHLEQNQGTTKGDLVSSIVGNAVTKSNVA